MLTLTAAMSIGCVLGSNVALPLLPPVPALVFEIVSTAPAGAEALPDGFAGSTFSFVINTRGGTIPLSSCSITSAPGLTTQPPPSLTITVNPANRSQCILSGTIQASLAGSIPAGGSLTFTFTVRAADSGAPALSDTQDYTIRVFAGFSFTTATIENGTVGRAFTKTITTNLGGGIGVPPLTACSAVFAPANPGGMNVTFSGTTCTLSAAAGAITTAGAFTVTFTGTDSGANTRTSAAIPLTINGVLAIPPPTLGNGKSGTPFGPVNVPFTGGQTPYTCSGAGLPAGMSVPAAPSGSNCQITGTPTATGPFSVTVTVTDTATVTTAAGAQTTAPASPLTINDVLAIATLVSDVLDGVDTRTYTLTFTNTGGQTSFTWSNPGAQLGAGACVGLSLSAAGVLNGTVTGPGVCTFDARVTDTATTSTAATSATVIFTLTKRAEFAVAAPNFVDGAEQRTYGNAPQQHLVATNVLAVAGASDFGQGAEIGNGPLTACAVTSVVLLAGAPATPLTTANFTALVDPTNGNRCRFESVGALPAGSAADYTVTVTATDTAIGTVAPNNTRTNAGPFRVQPALALAANLANPLPTAVTTRSYGQGAGCSGGACTPVIYTASGGIAPYAIAVTSGTFPANFSATSTATTLTFFSANVTSGPGGPTTIVVTVTDVGNAAVPAAPGVPVTVSRDISVLGGVTITPNVAGAAPPDGVQGRPYGGTGFAQLVYTASGGTGGYTFAAINTIGAPGAGVPGTPGVVCSATAAVLTCGASGGSAAITAGIGPYAFTVDVSDTANVSVPSGTATPLGPLTINVRTPLALAVNMPAPNLNEAVRLRSYGTAATGCTPGPACNPVRYSASGGLGAYVFTSAPTPFPPGTLSCLVSVPDVLCTAASVTAAAGSYPGITMRVDDIANLTTPSGFDSVVRDLTVVPEMVFTVNFTQAGTPLAATASQAVTVPDGVEGRPYGASAFDPTRNPLNFDATGGLAAATSSYGFFTTGLILPPPMSCFISTATQVQCSTFGGINVIAPGTAASSPFLFNISVFDSGNDSVPTEIIGLDNSLTVHIPLNNTVNPFPFPTAVNGRAYGSGTGCTPVAACTPITYTIDPTSGLPPYTFAEGTGAAAFPTGITCSQAANVFTCAAASVTGAAGPYNPEVTIDDTFNPMTPRQGVIGPFTIINSLTVNGPLLNVLSQQLDFVPNFALNPDPLPLVAEVGRSYGEINGGAARPRFDASGGLGSGTYQFCISAGAAPTNVVGISTSCAAPTVADFVFLSASSVLPVGGAAGNFPFTVQLTDTGNQSAPGAGAPAPRTTSIDVVAALALAQTPTSPGVPDAVVGRAYGTGAGCSGGACVPVQFDASTTGIAPYTYAVGPASSPVPGTIPPGVAPGLVPAPVACTQTAPGGPIMECSGGPITGTPGNYDFQITVEDAGNFATPGGAPFAFTTPVRTVIVRDVLEFSLNQEPPPVAVDGRPYGQSGGTALIFTATAGRGLGGFNWTQGGSLPAGMSCTPLSPTVSATLTCSAGNITGGAGGPFTFDVTLADTPNATTPGDSTFTDANGDVNHDINVNAALSISNTTIADSIAVLDRPYGNGSGCSGGACIAPTYVAVDGTGNYSFVGNLPPSANAPVGTGLGATPGNLLCLPTAADTITCDSGAFLTIDTGTTVAGPYPFTIRVTDTGNTAVPGGNTASTTGQAFLVFGPLEINEATMPNGLINTNYEQFLTTSGGLSVTSSVIWTGPGNVSGSGLCTPSLGTGIPNSLSTSQVPAVPSGPDRFRLFGQVTGPLSLGSDDFTFQVCVEDSPNQSTAAGFALPPTDNNPSGGFPGTDYVVHTFDALKYVPSRHSAGTGAGNDDIIEVINPGGNVASIVLDSVAGFSGTGTENPDGVAITPDGSKAFVTLEGTNQVVVIDTITQNIITTISTGACTGPRGIAIGLTGSAANKAYVACTNDLVAEINTSTNALITSVAPAIPVAIPNSGGAGQEPDSVAVTPDGATVYVTVRAHRSLFRITTSSNAVTEGTTFFPATADLREVAISNNGARAFFVDTATNNEQVYVVTVPTTLSTTVTFSNGAAPIGAAVSPDDRRVYITRSGSTGGSTRFSVLDNTVAAASVAQITNSPFALAGSPWGVTIPPLDSDILPQTAFQVFITLNGTTDVEIVDNNITSDPASSATINLSANMRPRRIATIPVPQLFISTNLLPNATTAGGYSQQLATQGHIGAVTWVMVGLVDLGPPGACGAGGTVFTVSPAGLLSQAGVLSGGVCAITVQATDSRAPTPQTDRVTIVIGVI